MGYINYKQAAYTLTQPLLAYNLCKFILLFALKNKIYGIY